MYSPRVIEEKLQMLADADRQPDSGVPESMRFDPVEHTRAECQEMAVRLAKKVAPESMTALTVEERRWIRHEKLFCAASFPYWSERYARINDWTNRLSYYTPNIAQRIVLDMWGQLEDRGLAVMLLQLKARQTGVSTKTELAVEHRIQFNTDVNATVASADPGKSLKMAGMITLSLEHQPWFLMPRVTRNATSKVPGVIEFGDLNSGLSIQHGAQFSGISRGSTPTVVHLCLAPNTLIRVADGALKPISEVTSGDVVCAGDGRMVPVKAAWKSPRTNELTSRISIWGEFSSLDSTRDHPVLTSSGFRPAAEINAGDVVMRAVRPITNDDAERKAILVHKARGVPRANRVEKPLTRVFELSPAWGYLVGLYLAEGSLQSGPRRTADRNAVGVILTVHEKEVDHVSAMIRAATGPSQHIGIQRRTSKSVNVAIHDAALARWFCAEIGDRDNKRIPDWAWGHGRDFALQLIRGYIDGDGHWAKDSNEISATSVRVQLPVQVRELVASLGFGWSSVYYRDAGVYYERNCRQAWTWSASGVTGQRIREACGMPFKPADASEHWRYIEHDGVTMLGISVVERGDGFSESFYDLEVDDSRHDFSTAQCTVHNSEVASFKNPEQLIEAALLRALHETPWVFVMMESTAEGCSTYWHKKWLDTKNMWEAGKSRFMPCFLPWYVARDLYPTETWLKKQPIPGDWIPSDEIVLHAKKAALYVQSNEMLSKYLGSGWQMSREQMWYYESEKSTAERNGVLKIFLQEMPADDAEAFQSSGTSVFPADTINIYTNVTRSRPPVGLYGIISEHIPRKFHPRPHEFDTSKPRIAINADWGRGDPVSGELVPLKFKGYTDTDPNNKLWVFEKPDPNEAYGIGVDTAEGVGQERAAIEGLRKGSPWRGPGQVCEFVSDTINAFNLWPIAMMVATWYSPGRRQARAVIECKGNGESVQLEMRKHGWTNFHPWQRYDSKNLDPSRGQKIGWYTNVWSRDLLLDMLQSALNDQWIEILSPFFVEEMDSFEDNGARMEHQYGAYDDRLMSLGMVLISLHILELRGFQARRATGERIHAMAKELQPAHDDPTFTPSWQARDVNMAKPKKFNRTMAHYYSQAGRGKQP